MARARNIKPGLFKNEILGVADPIYTLLFEGLWVLADRDGRLEDRPLRIKGEIFPYREGLDVDGMLGWLQDNGFIRRYERDGKKCIAVLEFVKHQNPHKNESASELPPPDDCETGSVGIGSSPDNIGSAPADSLYSDSLYSDPLQSSPASAEASAGGRDRGASAKGRKAGYTAEFEAAWADYPSRPGNSKQDAFKAWCARIKSGVVPSSMHDGVKRYAAYCLAAGTDPRFIKQAATFFGPGEHYLGTWDPPRPQAGKRGATRHNGFDGIDYRKGINDDGTFE